MSKFPLYDNLSNKIPDKDLTTTQKNKFMKNIDIIDTNARELVYAIIKTYETEHTQQSDIHIPFQGEYKNNKLTFNLEEFPNPLKQILFKFLNMNIKKIKEDKKIEKNTPVKRF